MNKQSRIPKFISRGTGKTTEGEVRHFVEDPEKMISEDDPVIINGKIFTAGKVVRKEGNPLTGVVVKVFDNK